MRQRHLREAALARHLPDALLVRGTGRTDFQNGDPRAQYESLFGRLLKLPESTLVYPAHDYKGDMVSTIGEEKAFNPRLQVKSMDEAIEWVRRCPDPMPGEEAEIEIRPVFEAEDFGAEFTPTGVDKLQHYKGERPIFDLYNIDTEIERALAQPNVVAVAASIFGPQMLAMMPIAAHMPVLRSMTDAATRAGGDAACYDAPSCAIAYVFVQHQASSRQCERSTAQSS